MVSRIAKLPSKLTINVATRRAVSNQINTMNRTSTLKIPAFTEIKKGGVRMTKETDGFDKSNSYLTPALIPPLKGGGGILI